MEMIIFYLIAIVLGFVLQTLLHGSARMAFYLVTGFIAGLLFSYSYLPLVVCIGAGLKMSIGRYVHCLILMILMIAAGFVITQFFQI